ncbi:hypothetical protein [Paractinoplanes globisporus]|uniref:Uncharacterized protein n=1 Tax=Paractinoplanes globisporus TaxID=113565 RepID=A0ABW6W632_9ACTN|nr:hypothetical protein [Actinoplanes globisporus]
MSPPRSHHGSGDPPPHHRPRSHGGGGSGSIRQAEEAAAHVLSTGRSTANGGAGPSPAASGARPSADDVLVSSWEDNYAKLSDPSKFNVEANDQAYSGFDAHTEANHGPQVPLQRAPDVKTIEGRIYGDDGWDRPMNGSLRWTDPSTMNRTINDYVSRNWEQIRSDLAVGNKHRAVFDAGRRVGEGYVNKGMGGAGPREAQYVTTSVVRILIDVVPGSDPPVPFIVTAFPSALG